MQMPEKMRAKLLPFLQYDLSVTYQDFNFGGAPQEEECTETTAAGALSTLLLQKDLPAIGSLITSPAQGISSAAMHQSAHNRWFF